MEKNQFLVILLAAVFTFELNAKECQAGKQVVSCEGVKHSKRKNFCWKGKVSEERKAKICKKVTKNKASKLKRKIKNTAKRKEARKIKSMENKINQ